MIFCYLLFMGLVLCKAVQGYELIDVLNIFSTGNCGAGQIKIFEIVISLFMYFLSVNSVIKSFEKVNIFYDYISVRKKQHHLFFYEAIKNVLVSSLIIGAQKVAAEGLLMILEQKHPFIMEYLFQNIVFLTTIIIIGLIGIIVFYQNLYSNKIATIASMCILICIFLNVKEIVGINIVIPQRLNSKGYPVIEIIIKIAVICMSILYLNNKNKTFERIGYND